MQSCCVHPFVVMGVRHEIAMDVNPIKISLEESGSPLITLEY